MVANSVIEEKSNRIMETLITMAKPMELFFGKVLGASMGAKIANSDPKIVKYIGLALLPQGGISIGLSMVVARELPSISSNVITLILFSVLFFEIMGPILAKYAITQAGETNV